MAAPISITLKTARQRLAATLGDPVLEFTATGGSVTTLTAADTSVLGAVADYWNGYWVYIAKDGGGANAAPELQAKIIKDYTTASSVGTITVASPFSAA